MKHPVPTTIFSGFLGSGKTTIIMHVVEELQAQGQQVVYIKNEIGDTDLDGQLMRTRNVRTRELLNGCICCTLVGPFTAALTEVVEQYDPVRIFIEASGAADPSALALMVSAHPLLRRDGVIGVVDVLNFTGYSNLTETTRNQTKFIDLLVFNKVEQATIEEKRRVVEYVRELNTHSPIIEAPNGKLPAAVLLGLDTKELSQLLPSAKNLEETSSHIAHDMFSSFTVRIAGKANEQLLLRYLSTLPPQLFRAKGIVQLKSNEWVACNMVGGRTDLQRLEMLPQHVNQNVLVFIGVNAHKQETIVRQSVMDIFK